MDTELKFIRLASGFNEVERELNQVFDSLNVKNIVLVVDPNIAPLASKTIDFLSKRFENAHIYYPTSNREAEVNEIFASADGRDNDIVLGIGGGRTIDVAKMSAQRLGAKTISFPTLVSHDGIASPVAVLLNSENKKQSLPATMPVAVIVDLEIIGRAPMASIRAGVGDLVSNFSAIEDWKLSVRRTGEEYHDLAAVISCSAANSIFEMSEIGETYARHPEFISRLVQGAILSGIAMSIAGSSRPASGAEHNISHAIDTLYNLDAYHGEQVALGTILATYLRDGPWEKIMLFFQRLGLPVTSVDIGLSEKDYIKAVLEAPKTRKGRYTILDELDLSEIFIKEALTNIEMRLKK